MRVTRSNGSLAWLLGDLAALSIERGDLARREHPVRLHSAIHNIRDGFGAMFWPVEPTYCYRCSCGVMRAVDVTSRCLCGTPSQR